ncbi:MULTISPECIES: MarR family winged helix-turn-helix transcriptional regulator [Ferrimicrobium]|uniref:MarR family winged helix-turn-helix transcriptional regulator n=1 Tax=Ferrimicrobium acidiphilum TaxID=121039 RepID=A0ABV3Y1B8_9ACTN|nr:MarR family transcriptional regulator [Ferrimicrobium sp.]
MQPNMQDCGTSSVKSAALGAFRSILAAHARLLWQLDLELNERNGMSFADFEVLLHLEATPDGELRLSELAELALLSRSALSRRVDSLVAMGWVSRRSCPTDRRGTFAVLTEVGREKFEEALSTHDRVLTRMLTDRLGDAELVSLQRALDEVANGEVEVSLE